MKVPATQWYAVAFVFALREGKPIKSIYVIVHYAALVWQK